MKEGGSLGGDRVSHPFTPPPLCWFLYQLCTLEISPSTSIHHTLLPGHTVSLTSAHNCEYTDTAIHQCMGQKSKGSTRRLLEEKEHLICHHALKVWHEYTKVIFSGWINTKKKKMASVAWITFKPVSFAVCSFWSEANYSSPNSALLWLDAWVFLNE